MTLVGSVSYSHWSKLNHMAMASSGDTRKAKYIVTHNRKSAFLEVTSHYCCFQSGSFYHLGYICYLLPK